MQGIGIAEKSQETKRADPYSLFEFFYCFSLFTHAVHRTIHFVMICCCIDEITNKVKRHFLESHRDLRSSEICTGYTCYQWQHTVLLSLSCGDTRQLSYSVDAYKLSFGF